MRVVLKDDIRFRVAAGRGVPAELEIRVRPDRHGGWEASALLHRPDAGVPVALGRVFRSRDRRLAADKMVAWVRRRYVGAEPLATRRSVAPVQKAGAGPVSRN